MIAEQESSAPDAPHSHSTRCTPVDIADMDQGFVHRSNPNEASGHSIDLMLEHLNGEDQAGSSGIIGISRKEAAFDQFNLIRWRLGEILKQTAALVGGDLDIDVAFASMFRAGKHKERSPAAVARHNAVVSAIERQYDELGAMQQYSARDPAAASSEEEQNAGDELDEDQEELPEEDEGLNELGDDQLEELEEDEEEDEEEEADGQLDDGIMFTTGTRDIVPKDVVFDLINAVDIGAEKARRFADRFDGTAVTPPKIRKPGEQLQFYSKYSNRSAKTCENMYTDEGGGTIVTGKLQKARDARNMFHQLLVIKDHRPIDVDDIVKNYEMADDPAAFVNDAGDLRLPGDKASLGNKVGVVSDTPPDVRDCRVGVILDGCAAMQANPTTKAVHTFGAHRDIFVRTVEAKLTVEVKTVHVCWDRHHAKSVKDGTRRKRSRGKRRGKRRKKHRSVAKESISDDMKMPRDWTDGFISSKANKILLVRHLAEGLDEAAAAVGGRWAGVELIQAGCYALPTETKASGGTDVASLKCDHEEADTRIPLHASFCKTHQDMDVIKVYCRDTDVRVMLLSFACGYPDIFPETVSMMFGTTKKPQWMDCRQPGDAITADAVANLIGYHSLTGCDTVPGFAAFSKVGALPTYTKHAKLLDGLGRGEFSEATLADCEKLVCQLYQPGTDCVKIMDLRLEMFNSGINENANLPPTAGCLRLQLLKVHYQARIWYLSLTPMAADQYGRPEDHGWEVVYVPATNTTKATEYYRPVMMDAAAAPKKFDGLTQCSCKTGCGPTSRCKCVTKKLRCTPLCKCRKHSAKCRNCAGATSHPVDMFDPEGSLHPDVVEPTGLPAEPNDGLNGLKVEQLKTRLKNLNLPTSGAKAVLRGRLRTALAEPPAGANLRDGASDDEAMIMGEDED